MPLELEQVPAHRGQNPENAQVVWPVQKRGRFARNQGHRAKAHGENAQVRHRRQSRDNEKIIRWRDIAIQFAVCRKGGAARVGKEFESKSACLAIELNSKLVAAVGVQKRRPEGWPLQSLKRMQTQARSFQRVHRSMVSISEHLMGFFGLLRCEGGTGWRW